MKRILNLLMLLVSVMPIFAYTITLDIDNADAVWVEVDGSIAEHHTGANKYTFAQQIIVNANDGYTITSALDLDTNLEFAQLAQQQSVKIVGEVSTDMGESTSYDGHTISIKTKDLNAPKPYSVTINIDNPLGAYVKVGPTPYFDSSSSRSIELTSECVVVRYDDTDKYLMIQAKDFMSSIHSVKLNDSDVSKDPYEMTPTWIIPLSAARDGSVVDIAVNSPDSQDIYTLTAIIDDPSLVKFFSKMPADVSLRVNQGTNTIMFGDGDYFEVFCSIEAPVCTLDGEPIDWNGYAYRFTPRDGSVFELRFDSDAGSEDPIPTGTFTLDIDHTEYVLAFRDYDTYELIELTDGVNTIKLAEDHEYFMSTVNQRAATTFTVDGKPVEFNGYSYLFYPKDGSKVVVRFGDEADGIQTVTADSQSSPIYNIHGIQVTGVLTPGIYIQSGTKIMIR